MPSPRIKVKVVVPYPPELTWLGISLVLHTLAFGTLALFFSGQTPTYRSAPSMQVRLVPGPSAGGARTAPRPALARPSPPQPAKVDEKAEPTRRFRSQAEKNAVDRPTGLTAQPAELPQAQPRPPSLPEIKGSPTGSPQGQEQEDLHLPEGPIEGGVAGDFGGSGGTADWYRDLVTARLQDSWRDRPLLPAGWKEARVVVGAKILRDGKITEVRILIPSGYTPLDQSAYRVLANMGTLPRPPALSSNDGMSARFVFELTPPGED